MTARGMVRIVGMILALAGSASPAASQIEPLIEGDPVLLPGIDVVAFGGPPWWTVSDADSTVYILASPVAPVASWDTSLLQQRLKGANRLILQPDMKAGLAVAMPQLKAVSQAMLRGKVTNLENNCRRGYPELICAFRNARQKAGLPETRYGGLPLTLASFALAGDVYEGLPYPDLAGEPVEQTAARIAQGLNVPAGPVLSYGGRNWAGFLNQLRAVDPACVGATLQDLDQAPARVQALDPDRFRAMTQAWAHGDVTSLIAAYRDGSSRTFGIGLHLFDKEGAAHLIIRSPLCLRQIPLFKQISDRWLTDETEAVVQALKTPGKTVVVYRATDLLFVGGVIDQLAKRGFTVKAPRAVD